MSTQLDYLSRMSDKIEPTFGTMDAVSLVGKSRAWVQAMSSKHSIGTLVRGQWRFTRRDITALKRLAAKAKMGNPNWLPGKPQPHRRKKKAD